MQNLCLQFPNPSSVALITRENAVGKQVPALDSGWYKH